jgi:hypothetical protein
VQVSDLNLKMRDAGSCGTLRAPATHLHGATSHKTTMSPREGKCRIWFGVQGKFQFSTKHFRTCVPEYSPLWTTGQISWLQILMPGFDSRRYQVFGEVVGVERGPLSLVSTTEELLDRKVATAV